MSYRIQIANGFKEICYFWTLNKILPFFIRKLLN